MIGKFEMRGPRAQWATKTAWRIFLMSKKHMDKLLMVR